MKVLLKQVRIICTTSPFHEKTKDILIENGIISQINDTLTVAADQIIDIPELHVSLGWLDSFAHFCDPGYEYRETIESGIKAAAAGGFTDVLIIPNTKPVIHTKAQLEYINHKSANTPVTVHPIGAVTQNAEGKELAEMYDMHAAGAKAFSDGLNCIQSSGLLLKALQYVLPINSVIIQLPDDRSIQPHGLMHEGINSTQLGLPGRPTIAEELIIARDIELVKYTGSAIHFTGITTMKSVELIEAAKKQGLNVSCSVSPAHLYFNDNDLKTYNSHLKLNPPLRSQSEMLDLRNALASGKIDCIASHHIPQHSDAKNCEFEYAKNGMLGLETCFGVVGAAMESQWSLSQFILCLTDQPRKIFNLPIPKIEIGAVACLTLFQPHLRYIFESHQVQSASANTPYIGKSLLGKVAGIIHNQHVVLS